MKNINLESNLGFDYSLGTEERFALRRWLNDFVESINSESFSNVAPYLNESFEAFGFTDDKLTAQDFLVYLVQSKTRGLLHIRMPDLKVRKKRGLYEAVGSLEGLSAKMLLFEGEVELKIGPTDSSFQILFLTFSPRLKVEF